MFGLFSKDRSLKRAMDKVSNQHAQSPDRWAAMEKLGKAGTEDALFALCKRFSFKYDKTIEDAQEKEWVVETVAGKGASALPALRRYMKSATTLHYPLVILGKIAPPPATILEVIDEILATEAPGYTRDPERRTDAIAWLGEWEAGDAAEVVKRIIPYLEDFDENVRYKAVDSIALKPHESAAEPLLRALVRPEEESRRLKVRVAEVLAENQWDLGEHKAAVSAMMEGGPLSGWKMHHDRLQMPPGRTKAG